MPKQYVLKLIKFKFELKWHCLKSYCRCESITEMLGLRWRGRFVWCCCGNERLVVDACGEVIINGVRRILTTDVFILSTSCELIISDVVESTMQAARDLGGRPRARFAIIVATAVVIGEAVLWGDLYDSKWCVWARAEGNKWAPVGMNGDKCVRLEALRHALPTVVVAT